MVTVQIVYWDGPIVSQVWKGVEGLETAGCDTLQSPFPSLESLTLRWILSFYVVGDKT